MNRILHYFQLLCFSSAVLGAVLVTGCAPQLAPEGQRRGDRTRETVARATQRMKPELEWTAEKLGSAAEWAADETLAGIEGFFEGWFRPSAQAVNVNSASERQLENLPGLTAEDAHRIIRSRPYDDRRELLKKHAISEAAYARIRDQITTK